MFGTPISCPTRVDNAEVAEKCISFSTCLIYFGLNTSLLILMIFSHWDKKYQLTKMIFNIEIFVATEVIWLSTLVNRPVSCKLCHIYSVVQTESL